MRINEFDNSSPDECTRCYGLKHHPSDPSKKCPECKGTGKCPKAVEEAYKKTDYVRCPDGQRHKWDWNGSFGNEAKTNRFVEGRKCSNCGLTKKVFGDTGQRVNR